MEQKEFKYICEIKRQVGDFNILKFPIEFWKDLNLFQPNDKVKLTISKINDNI